MKYMIETGNRLNLEPFRSGPWEFHVTNNQDSTLVFKPTKQKFNLQQAVAFEMQRRGWTEWPSIPARRRQA